MPVFLLERFASDFVRPIPFSKVPFFLIIFLFPIFCSQSIFVRCQFFTWSCLLPIFSVRFLFLRCHFFLYLFVSHFLFSVHFCKMRVFHLELFPSQFRSDSFFSGAIFLFFLLAIVSSQSMFVRCQFFTAVVCFPFFSQSMPGFLFASHFLVPVHSFTMQIFPLEWFASDWAGPSHFSESQFYTWNPLFPRYRFPHGGFLPCQRLPSVEFPSGASSSKPTPCHMRLPRVASAQDLSSNFFGACACHDGFDSHQARVHPRLGLAICACHIPIRDVSFGTFALPRAPASVSSPWFS